MESLSSYAKRFVAQVAKPDVDFVFGLSPVISIEQKTIGQQPALDRRHDDRHRELPEPAVRDHRRAALPAHRRADAEPHAQPDRRGDPVAARRDRDRAARAGVQGLRRGAGLRLHRGAQEGLPPPDRRRHARSTWPTASKRTRRPRRPVRRAGHEPGRRSSTASSSGRGTRRRSRRRSRAALLVGDGLLQVHVVKRRDGRAAPSASHDALTQPHAPLRLRRHRARVLRVQQPRGRLPHLRRARRRQADAPGAAGPRPAAQHPRRLLRARGVQVQPGHLGRAGHVQPVAAARLLARHAVERRSPRACGTRMLYGIDAEVRASLTPPDAKVTRDDWEGHEVGFHGIARRIERHYRRYRQRGEASSRDGGVARQGDGRAHLPRLPRARASARRACCFTIDGRTVHDVGQLHFDELHAFLGTIKPERARRRAPARRCCRRSAARSSCCSASASTT